MTKQTRTGYGLTQVRCFSRAGVMIRMLLAVLCLVSAFSCKSSDDLSSCGRTKESIHIAKAKPVVLSPAEEQIVSALKSFYADLTRALKTPKATSMNPAEIAHAIKRFSDPALDHLTRLTTSYKALGEERRKTLEREFIFRNLDMLQEFIVAAGSWSEQFGPSSRAAEYKPVLREVLYIWYKRDAMWVFHMWSDEAVEELVEWVLPEGKTREDDDADATRRRY